MKAQVHSVPGQTEGRRKAFPEWKSIDLSQELFLIYVGNVNYHKSVYHSIVKINQEALLSIQCPGIFSSWPN